jgi:hypothetical protein
MGHQNAESGSGLGVRETEARDVEVVALWVGRSYSSADECFLLASEAKLIMALHVYMSSVS